MTAVTTVERQGSAATIAPPSTIPEITGDVELDHALYLLAMLALEVAEGIERNGN